MKDKDREKAQPKYKVLFICLGNICRSPAAEGMFKQYVVNREGSLANWGIDSAGIGRWHVGQLPDHRMRTHARRRGLELNHYCRQVTTSDFFDFDYIIGMDAQNIADLHRLAPTVESEKKILMMGNFVDNPHYDYVPDPYYEGAEGFELVLDLLEEACENLYRYIVGHK